MKSYFAYLRVSTTKQGLGVSLQEQRAAIERYAARNKLHVSEWFEERVTAAKRGRSVFNRMLGELRRNTAQGVIIHKIDRSARNLRDWADLAELVDSGCEVRFATESLDLNSRGGRLSADIQAVVAADFIRNLREETRKGFYGRLKQGLYPIQAPIGYLDQGGGRPKIPDPERAPFIRQAFELYSTGRFSLHGLRDELYRCGLRGRTGKKVSINGLSKMLNNPFYIGIIRIRRTGETFSGIHEPLVSVQTFNRVQRILTGKTNRRISVHDFLFRRMIRCGSCQRHLIGELQKGRVYYRCHSPLCFGQSIREDRLNDAISARLRTLLFHDHEIMELRGMVEGLRLEWTTLREERRRTTAMQIEAITTRLSRLTDVYIEGAIDRDMFEERKFALLTERRELEDQQACLADEAAAEVDRLHKIVELLKTLKLSYEMGNGDEKREVLATVSSNLLLNRKNAVVELRSPFAELTNLALVTTGDPHRGTPRTRAAAAFDILMTHCKAEVQQDQREDLPLAA
jgi:DNA invertase Pin-like site-specific DNA recombinase